MLKAYGVSSIKNQIENLILFINILFLANSSVHRLDDLPEIKEGEPCELNKVYRMDCNTCSCQGNNHLVCTKMACGWQNLEMEEKEVPSEADKLTKEAVRSPDSNILPELPDGKCFPGKMYQKNCYGCFCERNKKAVCSDVKNACDVDRDLQIPIDVRPKFLKQDRDSLPSLPHMAARCEPGQTYRVDCNTCLCLSTYSLLCDKLLCISHDDMNRIEANKLTGMPCEKPPVSSKCVKCLCEKGLTKCHQVKGCKRPVQSSRSIHGSVKLKEKISPVKVALDLTKEQTCSPETVYKDNCNKCYCQDDEHLICTQKYCLNYLETLKLKKHRLMLEKNGL